MDHGQQTMASADLEQRSRRFVIEFFLHSFKLTTSKSKITFPHFYFIFFLHTFSRYIHYNINHSFLARGNCSWQWPAGQCLFFKTCTATLFQCPQELKKINYWTCQSKRKILTSQFGCMIKTYQAKCNIKTT